MASAESPGTMKYFTRTEVKNHDTKDTLLIIHNNVYDVTNFLNEHPGGQEVLMEQAGRDATEPFEDVAHSTDARKMMEPYKIGEIIAGERIETDKASKHSYSGNAGDDESSGSWSSWLIPFVLGIMATLIYRYFISTH